MRMGAALKLRDFMTVPIMRRWLCSSRSSDSWPSPRCSVPTLDEPATRRQGAQIPVQRGGGADEVHDGIYTSAFGSIKRSIEEVVFPVVHPYRTAHFADALHAFLAGSCENGLYAERVSKHDCRGSNTACYRMDK